MQTKTPTNIMINNSKPDELADLAGVLKETVSAIETKLHFSGDKGFGIIGNGYIAVDQFSDKLLPGYYTAQSVMGSLRIVPKSIVTDEIMIDIAEDSIYTKVVNEIEKFWKAGALFKQFKMLQKRGILLHGKPGCGKSSLINFLIHKHITLHNGIVFSGQDFDEMVGAMKSLRKVETEKPIMFVIEDLDTFISYNDESGLLSFLDGGSDVSNILTIATTNFLEDVPARFKNRARRFDVVMEVPPPAENLRRKYLAKKFLEANYNINRNVFDKLVKRTEGLPFSSLSGIIIETCIIGNNLNDVVKKARAEQKLVEMNDE